MSTFLTTTLTDEQAQALNVPAGSTVKDALDLLRASGYTVRLAVCELIMAGAFDRFLTWAEPQPEPTIIPVIDPKMPVNALICVDCGKPNCTWQMCHMDEETGPTKQPLPGDGLCQDCYLAFTLDVTRGQEEIDELNETLIAVG